ncbi:MAG: DUF2971 domain-containing protein [Anaerostipes sp.]
MRFSQYDCLNDANEGGEAVRIQKEICDELIKENTEQQLLELIEKISEVTPRYNALIAPKHGKPGKRTIKNGKLSGEASITVYNSETIPYICCFSKSKDSLPMWNYYVKGQRYEGYNIGIEMEEAAIQLLGDSMENIENPGISTTLGEVIYKEKEKKNVIRTEIEQILQAPDEFDSKLEEYRSKLDGWSICFKREAFRHEGEVRLICYVQKEKIADGCIKSFPTKFRTANGIIIPYVDILIENKNVLKRITIGPLIESDVAKITAELYMKEKGYSNVDVITSEVPIRY